MRFSRHTMLITGVLCGSLLFDSLAFAANFPDVPDTHRYADAIQTIKDAGIVKGYGDGTFKPDQPVSRAETLAIVLKAKEITAGTSSVKLPFTDVPDDAWFFPMVQKAFAMGKIKGYPDKTFRPAQAVTLPEALTLTLSFFQINVQKISVEPVIWSGLDTNDWYAKNMQYAKDKNLIEPDADGRIDPAASLTRGQLAEMIYRMRITAQTGKPFDLTKKWIETEHKENFWKIKHPADFEIFKGLKNSVMWKRDEGSRQAFFTRVTPASARLSISLVENPQNVSAASYFAQLKEMYKKNYPGTAPVFSKLTLSGRPALKIFLRERRIADLVLQVPNKQFLVMYGEYGEAPIGEWWRKVIETMEMSYQYVEKPPEPPTPVIPLDQRMETLRQNILVEGAWKEVNALFPDKKLISTDAIGIGTGPVDYYYSKEANHTIKLERNSGTVLNVKEGQTSAF